MSRIPETREADGIPDLAGSADDPYGIEPPRDALLAADDFGTTAAEMHDGEPLEARIAREEPDVLDRVDQDADESQGGPGVGRLVDPDEGLRADTEADLVAADVGADQGSYSAEESAMHLEPEV